MVSLNRATLIGHLGKDPETRAMQNGDRVANLSIATSESWTDKRTGEVKERTEWHRISVMNQALVKVVEQYAKKGSRIFVEGQIQTRKWTDQQGTERYSTEIILGAFNSRLILLDKASGESGQQKQGQATSNRSVSEELDDSIPF